MLSLTSAAGLLADGGGHQMSLTNSLSPSGISHGLSHARHDGDMHLAQPVLIADMSGINMTTVLPCFYGMLIRHQARTTISFLFAGRKLHWNTMGPRRTVAFSEKHPRPPH
jgi:hypothetical protein